MCPKIVLGPIDGELEHACLEKYEIVCKLSGLLVLFECYKKGCRVGIRESKVGGTYESYSLQSVVPERVEVFSITCVTERAPNQSQ